jgi:hypothetical protein
VAFKWQNLFLRSRADVKVNQIAIPELVMTKAFERCRLEMAKKGMIIAVLRVVKKELFQQADGPSRHFVWLRGILLIDLGSGPFQWNPYVPP